MLFKVWQLKFSSSDTYNMLYYWEELTILSLARTEKRLRLLRERYSMTTAVTGRRRYPHVNKLKLNSLFAS